MTTQEKLAVISKIRQSIEFLQEGIDSLHAWHFESMLSHLDTVKDTLVRDGK